MLNSIIPDFCFRDKKYNFLLYFQKYQKQYNFIHLTFMMLLALLSFILWRIKLTEAQSIAHCMYVGKLSPIFRKYQTFQ